MLETVATLTREVERANSEIKELRKDVNTLALTVTQLKSDLRHERENTRLVLDNHENDGRHLKESIESKFDVLVTRLDLRIAAFENRLPVEHPEKKSPRSLNSGVDE